MVNDNDWLERAKAAARSVAESIASADKAVNDTIDQAGHEIRKKVIGEDEARIYRNARITLGTANDQDILDMMNDVDAERQRLQNKNVAPCGNDSANNLPPKPSNGRRRQ